MRRDLRSALIAEQIPAKYKPLFYIVTEYESGGSGSLGFGIKGKPVQIRYSHHCCNADEQTRVIGESREDVLVG